MQTSPSIGPAFADGVHATQNAFRCIMSAFACPATIMTFAPEINPPEPLLPGTAAAILALADSDTPVWLADAVGGAAARDFITFHTGARVVDSPQDADFAVISSTYAPPVDRLRRGESDYPDRSATLIVQCEALLTSGYLFSGPGLRASAHFAPLPEWPEFASHIAANRASFPCGLDMLFVAKDAIAALPRSTRLERD